MVNIEARIHLAQPAVLAGVEIALPSSLSLGGPIRAVVRFIAAAKQAVCFGVQSDIDVPAVRTTEACLCQTLCPTLAGDQEVRTARQAGSGMRREPEGRRPPFHRDGLLRSARCGNNSPRVDFASARPLALIGAIFVGAAWPLQIRRVDVEGAPACLALTDFAATLPEMGVSRSKLRGTH